MKKVGTSVERLARGFFFQYTKVRKDSFKISELAAKDMALEEKKLDG